MAEQKPRPKRRVSLRLDTDVVDWFKTNAPGGRGYQTDINQALRDYVLRQKQQQDGTPISSS